MSHYYLIMLLFSFITLIFKCAYILHGLPFDSIPFIQTEHTNPNKCTSTLIDFAIATALIGALPEAQLINERALCNLLILLIYTAHSHACCMTLSNCLLFGLYIDHPHPQY